MRADRLLSILLLLRARGRMTAQDLAAQMEVSERTMYRDIDALCAAGVPVYTQPGPSGGIFLDEHYRVSLTGLSREQVLSLFVASGAGPLKDLGLDAAAHESLLKLAAALPSSHRQDAERMQRRFYIDPTNWFQPAETSSFLTLLQQAVWEDRRIRLQYRPFEQQAIERMVDAYALVAKANIWYLIGKKADGSIRNYRVSRIEHVELLDTIFTRDPAFDVVAYWQESRDTFEKVMNEIYPPYIATVRVHPEAFWYFPWYMSGRYTQIGEPDAANWVTVRIICDSLPDARMRVLGLGTHVEVVEPRELHDQVLAMARAIVGAHAV